MRFDLKDCVKSGNGKIYCYDYSIKRYIMFAADTVEIKEIPQDVIDTWLKMGHEAKDV